MASKYVFAVVLIVLGSVPTGAVVIAASAGPQADTTAGLELAPADGTNGEYANVSGDTLELNLEKLNDDAVTTAHDVFAITVTDEDISGIWIEGDIDGLTFYDGTDPTATISESNPLELTTGETTSVGVAVDTHEGGDSDGTFAIVAEYGEGDDESSSGPAIEASSLNVSPTTLESGEPVTVNATYRNAGSQRGTGTVRLTVDGTVVDRRSIELEPGEERAVSFERTMYWPGTYDVGIEGVGTLSLAGAALVARRSPTDLEAARRAVHERRYAEWISRGSIPMWIGDYHVSLDTLEDVVDVAIDTNERVVHDTQRGLFAVVNDGVVYYYSDRGLWEETAWPEMDLEEQPAVIDGDRDLSAEDLAELDPSDEFAAPDEEVWEQL